MSTGLYSDFESYRIPTRQEADEALRNGIVAVDTNVLLSLYRYAEGTVDDLFRLLERLGPRLFVPNQVLREFWRNRQSVLGSPAAANKDVKAALSKNATSSKDAVKRWAKSLALDNDFRDEVVGSIDAFYDEILARTENSPTLRVNAATPTSEDPVLTRLEHILEGCVGAQLSAERWTEAIAEGNRRVIAEEPPGYRDDDKLGNDTEEQAAGDYLVWVQLIEQASNSSSDLVLVTSDSKEDWWEKVRDINIGPRRELIEEFAQATSRRVFFLEPADFLDRGPVLDIEVQRSSVEDVERVRDAVVPWDEQSVFAVLVRLEQEGAVQAEVIKEAATGGGTISRERVYELDGRDDDQMLRGFTRPVTRITADLQAQGIVPEGLAPLLSSHYESGVKTTHFIVPIEVAEILS
jgi:predicted nucleic acid-binding protein